MASEKYGKIFSFQSLLATAFPNEVMKFLVTGATGFVGHHLCAGLIKSGHVVCGSVRAAVLEPDAVQLINVGAVHSETDWSAALVNVDVVVHLASRVHVMHDTAADPLRQYRLVNVEGTLNLARQAIAAGVRRFVFVSSVKVNGERTIPGHPFTETSSPDPQDAYSVSKYEAELGLHQLCADHAMEVVVIRPPLVYGPGVGANFAALLEYVRRGWPMPLGALKNSRSLVAVDNLVDFILVCSVHPRAANQTFLVSDGHDLSTPELIRLMAVALKAPVRLVSLPIGLLSIVLKMIGRKNEMSRLSGNLQVSIAKARAVLGWSPPISVDEGLRRTVVADPQK